MFEPQIGNDHERGEDRNCDRDCSYIIKELSFPALYHHEQKAAITSFVEGNDVFVTGYGKTQPVCFGALPWSFVASSPGPNNKS